MRERATPKPAPENTRRTRATPSGTIPIVTPRKGLNPLPATNKPDPALPGGVELVRDRAGAAAEAPAGFM